MMKTVYKLDINTVDNMHNVAVISWSSWVLYCCTQIYCNFLRL